MEEMNLPPGFRFHPTDEELITFYLTRKVSDVSFTCKAVVDVDLNKSEPWDLPGKASMGEKEWYFFNLRDRKYPTGLRTNRATEAGYWKTTGKDKEIYGGGGILVGMKKTLVFYKGRAPRGEKSNWVMHEYRIENKHLFNPSSKAEWVVCRVFQKSSSAAKTPQESSSLQQSSGSPCNTNSIVNEFEDVELSNLNSIMNSSTASSNGFNNNISTQSYNNETNVDMSMINTNLNMNWAATREAATATATAAAAVTSILRPSSLLSSNLAISSLILKALQLRSYQQGIMPQFGTTTTDLVSNFHASSSSSSSKVLESILQQQQHDQSFNLDSIWCSL